MPDGVLHGRRIVMVTHDYAPDLMGIAPYSTETAEWLARAGAQVDVLTMPPHYPDWKVPSDSRRGYATEERNGVTVRRLPTYVPSDPSLLRRLAFEGSWTLAAMPLRWRSVVRDADVVIGVCPGIFAAGFARSISGRRRPLIQIVQDLVGQAAKQSGMAGASRAAGALARMEARSLRAAHAVTVPGHGFVEPLRSLGVDASRIHVVANWSRVPMTDETEVARQDEKFVVMHAGNMGLKQGLDELAPIVGDLETSMPAVQFEFVGGGSQAGALGSAIADRRNARLRSHVPEDELATTLRSADALLVHERGTVKDMSLPSKLTTYFAMGRPVIAVTRADGTTAAEVRRADAGLVVEPGDSAGFMAAVERLRSDADLVARLARNGREYSRQHLDREVSLGAITQLVVDALDASPHKDDVATR
ncbi:glycosyltransferase family 4 protein [Aeromicrobium sp. 9AM]|uniref:glycosyltransferase family 4 protein n=1 Tax=Aeromicrobium sp. 9AM TaxID=2653126 RepID=UPI0012F43569|nr:glycosyltransferase family 4 protein [Aeromicrobium sp. 9AM]VXB47095.1 Glycosyltransferase WbuB [Aeromicrobium sp. 9AM]